MSAIARPNWKVRNDGLAPRPSHASVPKESSMRGKLAAIRDTMIVLSMQLVFRTVTLLRRWNY